MAWAMVMTTQQVEEEAEEEVDLAEKLVALAEEEVDMAEEEGVADLEEVEGDFKNDYGFNLKM